LSRDLPSQILRQHVGGGLRVDPAALRQGADTTALPWISLRASLESRVSSPYTLRMAAKKKSSRTRNPVVREATVLRKGGPHGKSTKAERANAKRKLLDDADD
jgi:hypothetical protein